MKLKFIHTADLHLDTPFKGLGDWNPGLAGKLKDATYRSFRNIIDLSISEKVDFILIAGDIFDSEIMSLAAQLRFLAELRRLSDNSIPAYFICGNHDHLGAWDRSFSLPPGVFRFGSTDVEKMTYLRNGEAIADIYGISYQDSYIKDNLAPLYIRSKDPALFSIAMLHGMADIVGRDERYAPFSLRDLTERPFDYWALGHVHKGRVLSDDPAVVYPGNPQGRDFGEIGQKGCCMVELEPGVKPVIKFVPVQHVRFEDLDIDLTGTNDISVLMNLIDEARDAMVISDRNSNFVLRILLTGRTGLHKLLNRPGATKQLLEELNTGQLESEPFSWIGSAEVMTSMPLDIENIGQGSDFIAGIIKNIVRYEKDGELLAALTGNLENELPAGRIFREIDHFSENEKQEILDKAKWILLSRLVDEGSFNDGS